MSHKKKFLVPANATPVVDNVLSNGEVTGHRHVATGEGATVFDLGDGVLVLDAPNGAEVVHEEHGKITLPPGLYDSSIVKEYDHAKEEARRVVD